MGFVRPPDELGHFVPAPRAEVRADEEMFYIPDQSREAACRAMIAADLDGVPRSSVKVVDGGLLVPHCVYSAYNELLDYPPPCCACSTGAQTLAFVQPQPLYFDDYEDLYCHGSGFTAHSQVCVNGTPVSTYPAYLVNPNLVVGFFDTFDQYAEGEQLRITVRTGDSETNPYTIVMQPRPPEATITGASPLTFALGQPFTVHVYGTNFREVDEVAWYPTSVYYYWNLPTDFISPTELVGHGTATNTVDTGPGTYKVGVSVRPLNPPSASRVLVTVS